MFQQLQRLLPEFLLLPEQAQEDNHRANDGQCAEHIHQQVEMVVSLLPRQVHHFETLGQGVEAVAVLLGHLPVDVIVFGGRADGDILGLGTVQDVDGDVRYIVGDGGGRGEVAGKELAGLTSEVVEDARQHHLAAHVGHGERLLVIFHLQIGHGHEAAHGIDEVVVAERVVLGMPVGGVGVDVVQ